MHYTYWIVSDIRSIRKGDGVWGSAVFFESKRKKQMIYSRFTGIIMSSQGIFCNACFLCLSKKVYQRLYNYVFSYDLTKTNV